MYKIILTWAFVLLLSAANAQNFELSKLQEGQKTSIRGLSVVDDHIIWASGSKGWVARSVDGGANWTWQQLKGYETIDFRDIEAFSADKAIIVSAGTPAYILISKDGGKTWQEAYKNTSPDIFLDGMDFWNEKQGIVFGDPIKGMMQVLISKDGGASWQNKSDELNLRLEEGEASFAASGTTIRTLKDGSVWIATGGKVSRVWHSSNYGLKWEVNKCPIIQGESTTGPFSMAFVDKDKGIVVGGNYVKDKDNTDNTYLSFDGGHTWHKPESNTLGYRSGVEYLTKSLLVATGTSGTDISINGGKSWTNIDKGSFNVVRKAKKGKNTFLAGENGKIYQLKLR